MHDPIVTSNIPSESFFIHVVPSVNNSDCFVCIIICRSSGVMLIYVKAKSSALLSNCGVIDG